MWSQMLVSTSGFLKSISNVSGKDIGPLIKQWVYPSNARPLKCWFTNFRFSAWLLILSLVLLCGICFQFKLMFHALFDLV